MGKLRVAECFLESETGKCLPGCSGIMWHNFQAGKHVHFLVLAFMWGGGVVSIFHICHLRGRRPSYWYRPVSVLRLVCFSVVLENNKSHALCFLLNSSMLSRSSSISQQLFPVPEEGSKKMSSNS